MILNYFTTYLKNIYIAFRVTNTGTIFFKFNFLLVPDVIWIMNGKKSLEFMFYLSCIYRNLHLAHLNFKFYDLLTFEFVTLKVKCVSCKCTAKFSINNLRLG